MSVLALVLGGLALSWGAQAMAGPPQRALEVRLQAVAPGETLWQYAAAIADPGEDLRDVVAELQRINGMATAELQVGQVVALPSE